MSATSYRVIRSAGKGRSVPLAVAIGLAVWALLLVGMFGVLLTPAAIAPSPAPRLAAPAPSRSSQPAVMVKAAQAASAVILDDNENTLTFEERWEPVNAMMQNATRATTRATATQSAAPAVMQSNESNETSANNEQQLFIQETKRKTRKSRDGNVCSRHGMYQVFYGRRWRCRR